MFTGLTEKSFLYILSIALAFRISNKLLENSPRTSRFLSSIELEVEVELEVSLVIFNLRKSLPAVYCDL